MTRWRITPKKLVRIYGRGGPDHLLYEEVPTPHPGSGEVLVRVAATAILVNELTWDITYQTVAGAPRPLPIAGRDLAGAVSAGVTDVAAGTGVAVGDAVYAMLGYGRDGAEAEYALAVPSELVPKPRMLDAMRADNVMMATLLSGCRHLIPEYEAPMPRPPLLLDTDVARANPLYGSCSVRRFPEWKQSTAGHGDETGRGEVSFSRNQGCGNLVGAMQARTKRAPC